MTKKRRITYQLRAPLYTDIIEFVHHHMKKKLSLPDSDDIVLSDDDEPKDSTGKIDHSSVATSSMETSRLNDTALSMDQCVAILEPHLEAFRLLNQLETKDEQSTATTKFNEFEIPSQLLRLARFFKWRWAPIRKAILRPASIEEIEIGSRVRLQLAMALKCRGFIAIAELDELILSFRQDNDTDELDSLENSPSDRIKAALLKLPIEASLSASSTSTLNAAIRHIKPILKHYCLMADSEVGTKRESLLPSDVAELALVAFTGITTSRGLENNIDEGIDVSFEDAEKSFVTMLCDRSKDGGIDIVTDEVHKLVTACLSTYVLDSLTGIQIYTISRMLYHMEDSLIEKYLSASIESCLMRGGTTGIASLPKIISLLATHKSIRMHFDELNKSGPMPCTLRKSYLVTLQLHLERNVKQMIKSRTVLSDDSKCKSTRDVSEFLSILFQVSVYLLNS